MTDAAPYLFRKQLGALYPANDEAQAALDAFKQGSILRGRFTAPNGNTRRMGLYWASVSVGRVLMSDALDGILSSKMVHEKLKEKLGLATPIYHRGTGKLWGFDHDSISFASMDEVQRAAFIDAALHWMANEIGCDPSLIWQQAQARTGLTDSIGRAA